MSIVCWECGHPIKGNGPSTCATCSAEAARRSNVAPPSTARGAMTVAEARVILHEVEKPLCTATQAANPCEWCTARHTLRLQAERVLQP